MQPSSSTTTQTPQVPQYALAVTDASFSAAARLVRQTGSYPRERALSVAGASAMLAGALTLTVALTAVLSMYVHQVAGGVVFLAAILGIVFVLMPRMERRFFAMRCAFAYLVTEALLQRTPIPPNATGEAAQRFLSEHFGNLAGPVYEAHMNVRRSVRTFFRTFDRLSEVAPFAMGPLRNAVAWVVDRVAPNIADLALSYTIARNGTDYAAAADDAVTYVAQNPKAILGTALRAHITERMLGGIIGFVILVLFGGATFAAVAAGTAHAVSGSGLPAQGAQALAIILAIFAAVFVATPFAWLASWFVRTAFLEPISLTMLIVRFHATIQGQAIDPSVRARLHTTRRSTNTVRGLASLFG